MSQSNMNHYSFISGKNWKLSLAEIIAFLNARKYSFEVSVFSSAFFSIKLATSLQPSIIDGLGGTLKIVNLAAVLPTSCLINAFAKEDKAAKEQIESNPLFADLSRKMHPSNGKSVFGVSVYWDPTAFKPAIARTVQRFFGSRLKDQLKVEGQKSRFMGFPKNRPQPQLTPVEVLKKGLVENRSEIVVCIGKTETSVGVSMAVHNPFEFQKRDLYKPVQRKIFAIPPRLAKIIVNLSQCAEGKVFLDPFCGVGTLLQEALLTGATVIGVDVNRWCVEAAKRNLEWLKHEYSLENARYSVFQGNARQLTSKIIEQVDCIATEPDLGPALRQVPTVAYAEKIINKLTPLYQDFLGQASQILSSDGKLVLTSPYIKTRTGKSVNMNIKEKAEKAALHVVKPFGDSARFSESASLFSLNSLIETDERHLIGREITILEKAL